MEIKRRLLFIVGFGFLLGSSMGAPSPLEIPSEEDPLSAVVVKMDQGMDILTTMNEELGLNTEKINELMEKLKQRMGELTIQIGETNIESIAHTHNAIKAYHTVTDLLRTTRNTLLRLSIKTVIATEDLKLYMEGWENNDPQTVKTYLKEQLKIMRDLLQESAPLLKDAEEKYNAASKQIGMINFELSTFHEKTKQLLNEESAEYKKNTDELRSAVYGSGAAVTIGLAIADALGCLGLCSAIGTTTYWGTAIPSVEIAIAEYKAVINQMKVTVANAISGITEIKSKLGVLSSFVHGEVEIVIEWGESVQYMKKKVDSATPESFNRLKLKRKSFSAAVERLQASAQAYRDKISFQDSQDASLDE